MRWFKHFTDAHIDSKLLKLRAEYGLEAYGLYWLILESVALEFKVDGEPQLDLLPKTWSNISGISSRKFKKLTLVMAQFGLLKFKILEKYWRVEVPKLIKIRDEYTRKSGVTQERLRNRGKEVRESEKELKTDNMKVNKQGPDKKNHKAVREDSGNFEKVINAWKDERKKRGLGFVRSDFSTSSGAAELAALVDSRELTVEQIKSAMVNLLEDPKRQRLWTLAGLARNISSWIGQTTAERTVQLNTEVKVTFTEGRCGKCGKDSASIPRGKKTKLECRYCGTEFEVK